MFLRDVSGIDVVITDSVDCPIAGKTIYLGSRNVFENHNGKCRIVEYSDLFFSEQMRFFKVRNDTCSSFTENDEWPFEKDSSITCLDYEDSQIYWSR